jgi:predicted secreted protein
MRRLTAPGMAALLLAAPALAHSALAQVPVPTVQTVLKLAETATVTIRPDELAASLRAEAVASSAAEAQARVNAAIADALARAQAVSGVSVSTGGYSVYRTAPNPNDHAGADKTERWQAGQSLELKSADGAALPKLVGELQKSGLAVRNLGWRLSPEAARRARAEATRLALAGLRGRADEAAAQIGLAFEGFKEIRLDSERPAPFAPRMMSAAMAAGGAPPPSAEAEDLSISATAEADVLLRSR